MRKTTKQTKKIPVRISLEKHTEPKEEFVTFFAETHFHGHISNLICG